MLVEVLTGLSGLKSRLWLRVTMSYISALLTPGFKWESDPFRDKSMPRAAPSDPDIGLLDWAWRLL